MRKFFSLVIILILFSTLTTQPVSAQSSGPVYIVQPGDTLSFIAARFNVTLSDILAANPTVDPNLLSAGQEIVIPGLEGVSGILTTEIVPLGDTLRSLSRRTQVSDEQLRMLNRIVSPTELYVGISLIVPVQEGQEPLNFRTTPVVGESLLELAIKNDTNPWSFASINKLAGTWAAIPNDTLYSPTLAAEGTSVVGLPSAFLNASISSLPVVQGSTEVVRVQMTGNTVASGTLFDYPLKFFSVNGEQIALQGVHAMLEPGVYPLRIEATLEDGSKQSFEQMVVVQTGNYLGEEIYVDPITIDPAATKPEDQTILSVIAPSTSTKLWAGLFSAPAVFTDQFTSFFGTRRTYHGIGTELTIEGFHSGLDFAGGEGLEIFAPAPGRVVFAAPLTVRGNATIIDHGWGVYSGFWHQSEFLVNVGDVVTQGQVIGLVGKTGRVTGAHLHWEVWVNGVQVNPLDWLDQAYP